jgi:outer membrane protein OmpA-like peptidoglycan-associated protein
VAGRYREDLDETDHGINGLVGFKLGLSRHVGLRADGLIDYFPSPFNESPTNGANVHYSVRAGLSILVGKYPPNQDSIRADSIQRAEQAKRLAERARADSIQLAAQARTDSIQRAERARADSLRQMAVADSIRAAQRAHEDSLRMAGQVDSMQMRLMLERKQNLVLRGVTFEFNKSRLTLNAQKVLDFVAQSLVAHPEAKIEVGGYTDNVGSAGYNQRLSEARARSVRNYLAQHGVAAAQLTAVGHGESDPVASNDTEEGRAVVERREGEECALSCTPLLPRECSDLSGGTSERSPSSVQEPVSTRLVEVLALFSGVGQGVWQLVRLVARDDAPFGAPAPATYAGHTPPVCAARRAIDYANMGFGVLEASGAQQLWVPVK